MSEMLPSEKFESNFTEETRSGGTLLHAVRNWGAFDRISCSFPEDDDTECSLELKGRFLVPSCSCAEFAAGQLCKHLWAALLTADKFEDLGKSLQKNVPQKLQAAIRPPLPQDEPHYDPVDKRRPARSRIIQDEGRILDYGQVFRSHPKISMPSHPVDDTLNLEILYVIRADKHTSNDNTLIIDLRWRPKNNGIEKPPASKSFMVEADTVLPSTLDAELLRSLSPCHKTEDEPNRYRFPLGDASIIEKLARCPALRWMDNTSGSLVMRPLIIDEGLPADTIIRFLPQPGSTLSSYLVQAELLHGGKHIPFADVKMLLQGNPSPEGKSVAVALARGTLLYADVRRAASLLETHFVNKPPVHLAFPEAVSLARTLAAETDIDTEDFPPGIALKNLEAKPIGELFVRTAKYKYREHEQLHADLTFQYNGASCPDDGGDRLLQGHCIIRRDALEEERLHARLLSLGFRYNEKAYIEEPGWKLHPSQLDEVVRTLVQEDWIVTAEGKTYRKPITKQPVVKSGVDWFEVDGGVAYEGVTVGLPALLAAFSKGEKAVRLDDGTYGLLPLEWLSNFTALTELGEVQDDKLHFRMEQAALVAAILGDRASEATGSYGEALRRFENLGTPNPVHPPDGFQANLRHYQAIGVGWLLNMQKAGLGACLADDMGLGKTIQVLAVLAARSRLPQHRPSLIVLPRSLIFNWQAEAARFAPWIRLLVHLGTERSCSPELLSQYDLVLTTYGTLRNDATKLAKVMFDYCVLDESQAIKNHDSSTAQAARCIHASYRIAMTGTPIENNLGELYSQLDFLNPGLFGRSSLCLAPSPGNTSENSVINRIRKGVRPFILRRTKAEVAKDLPPKSEQLLFCEMLPEEQEEYDELLHYYQKQLSDEKPGSSMLILAALTKLRQAACHPGLLKPQRINESSPKLELLATRLETIILAGHKALVFSQFTSFLKIIQARLEEAGWDFCYLDGETKDRAAVVERFQNDVEKKVFLISLKAGGVGLNLTAADYVFIMDPWWNPAAEAQAIDRAYRIGQRNPVMAYRLVTKNTVEEKVVQLQNAKRELASAVIDQNTDAPSPFSRKDLEALLRQ